jgi:transposase InsO family protein
LGFAGFLRDYIPKFSTIAAPLERIKYKTQLEEHWSTECEEAFVILKEVLSKAPVISTYNPALPLLVATDASLYGVGGVLYQEDCGKQYYLSFFSKALNSSQKNYPATKRELLGIVYSLKAFHHWIYGQEFTLFTDHKALSYLFSQKEPSYMLQNWAEELLNYKFTIVHRPGIEMVIPDSLSRLYYRLKEKTGLHQDSRWGENEQRYSATSMDIHLRATYIKCSECKGRASRSCANQRCRNHCQGCPIHPQTTTEMGSNNSQTEVEISIEQTEPAHREEIRWKEYIREVAGKTDPGTVVQRTDLIKRYHAINHQGGKNIQRVLWKEGWYWAGMLRDITAICNQCRLCIRYNVVRSGFHPLKTINATYPLDHVCLDLFTLNFTSRNGMNYVMVITDVATRFTFLWPLANKAATTAAKAFYTFMTTLGVPKIVQSDNGTEFNLILKAVKEQMGFDARTITPYYPQSNGTAESHVKLAKGLLIKLSASNLDEWDKYVSAVQMAINTRVTKRTRSTPFTLMFGRPLNPFHDYSQAESRILTEDDLVKRNQVLIDLIYPTIRDISDANNMVMQNEFNITHKTIAHSLPVGSLVMKLDKLRSKKTEPYYTGPFKVLRVTSSRTYVLEDPTGAILPKNATISELKLISTEATESLEREYEVESVLNHRGQGVNREYLIKWKGYSAAANSWEPAANVTNSQRLINDYLGRRQLTKRK